MESCDFKKVICGVCLDQIDAPIMEHVFSLRAQADRTLELQTENELLKATLSGVAEMLRETAEDINRWSSLLKSRRALSGSLADRNGLHYAVIQKQIDAHGEPTIT
ncbi:MAG: hypothetical protein CVV27_15325, partial [Candidatus Melainabacteria bacterium HGW-Melainabacteria-1]